MLAGFDASAPSPFDELPAEIMEHIFNFIDRKSLLHSLLVDKRFRDTIETSAKLMNKLPLTINLRERKPKIETQRRFSAVKVIDGRCRIDNHLKDEMKKEAPHVKTFEYVNWSGTSNYCLNELLSWFPKTETLSIEGNVRNPMVNPPQLPNLKTLKFIAIQFSGRNQFDGFAAMYFAVKHLHLTNLAYYCYCYVFGSFKNLRIITLDTFNAIGTVRWKYVIDNNPKLQLISIEVAFFEQLFAFQQLVSNARSGMTLKFRGNFRLTEDRLRQFKENSARGVRLRVQKSSLTMSEEVFMDIIGEKKEMVEFD